MTPTKQNNQLTLNRNTIEKLLNQAAERGARNALADVGLSGKDAQADIHELRSLLGAFRFAKRIAWQTVIKIVTAGFILTLMGAAAVKIKFFGGE